MKKILLSFFVLVMAAGTYAQSITETFDLYTADMYVAEQNPLVWSTWSGSGAGTGEDAMVSTAQANSGANSMLLENAATDIVLPLGDLTTGAYELTLMCYVPAGTGGYFNVLHVFDDPTFEWAIDIFFNGDGSGTNIAGGTEEPITYPEDAWFQVAFIIDLDADNATFSVDGTQFREWQWSLNGGDGAAGTNQLAAIDFYPAAVTGASFYVDDITFGIADAVSEVKEELAFNVSPNPANDLVLVTLAQANNDAVVTIFDITGKVVMSKALNGVQSSYVDLSGVQTGIYMVEVLSGNERQTKRLIVSK